MTSVKLKVQIWKDEVLLLEKELENKDGDVEDLKEGTYGNALRIHHKVQETLKEIFAE